MASRKGCARLGRGCADRVGDRRERAPDPGNRGAHPPPGEAPPAPPDPGGTSSHSLQRTRGRQGSPVTPDLWQTIHERTSPEHVPPSVFWRRPCLFVVLPLVVG